MNSSLGVVAIGRNEGERLRRCMRSVVSNVEHLVYVDSGSTDGSVAFARTVGAEVVELDMSRPFTMARGRNAGLARLLARDSPPDLVQFVDGDCELVEGWLETGMAELRARPELAAVSGRRRERDRTRNVFHRLTDMEWDTPVGETLAFHGDVMVRVAALRQTGSFDETMIAGEEPELSARLREAGWKLWRLDADMTLHDVDMHRFGQWWKRSLRSGYAYAEGAARHGRGPMKHWARQVRSHWFWGLLFPLFILFTVWPSGGWSLALLAAYPAMAVKIAIYRRRMHGNPWSDAFLYGGFVMLGKLPNTLGQATYWWNRWRGKRAGLIEYKSASPSRCGSQ